MGQRGPRPKKEKDLKSVRVNVYLTESEYDALVEKAGKKSRVPAWLRDAGLQRKLPGKIPELNRDAWAHLGRLTGGLNSVAKAAREGRVPGWTGDDRELVERLLDKVKALRRELIGVNDER